MPDELNVGIAAADLFSSPDLDLEWDPYTDSGTTMVFNIGSTEMLKISPEGFWVRGVLVPQDSKEAETVYKAVRDFVIWRELNKR